MTAKISHDEFAVHFVTYKATDGMERVVKFWNIASYWEWLQKFKDEFGGTPPSMCVFRADCVFDGS